MSAPDQFREEDIAVIGMACRFPGAPDVDAFLNMLREGREGLTHFTSEELKAAGIDAATVDRPDYVRTNGILPDPGRFDAAFFGYSPREAELLDVQQRTFLEIAWNTIEHAGYHPSQLPGPCGVFAGSGLNTYLLNQLAANPEVVESAGGFSVMIANDKDHLATRVAYKLDLQGPGLSIQTACSTSLVAVHLAVQSLLAGECEVALAGGVSVRVPQTTGYLYQEGMILSRDGHCRPFDAAAAGTVGGNGAGAILLKRAQDALKDGDTIHAIVRGSAINNDGAAKVGYTAPGLEGQTAVINEALAVADISSDEIGYVEAHGTGTTLGDPIEVAALTKAFRNDTDRNEFCALGAVKSNIGHLDAAAGIAGFIKTVLTLREGTYFPTLHHQSPHPQIHFPTTPFRVATSYKPWPQPTSHPRRASVSSFGIGGTNAHVVLEAAPLIAPTSDTKEDEINLFVLSARTSAECDQQISDLSGYATSARARDIAFTLAVGRKPMPFRAVLQGTDLATAQEIARGTAPMARPVVFLIPGQGAQFSGMASGLYRTDAVFRAQIDSGAELLKPHLEGGDIRDVLLAPANDPIATAKLQKTALTQPALFLVSHAMATRWISWGIEPEAMLGHSIGEWVAACLAGVFTVEEALPLVALRGRLMQEQPSGSMLAIAQNESDAQVNLPSGLTIAAINTPTQTVVSGPTELIQKHAAELDRQGVTTIKLKTSHAFHSASMQPAADAMESAMAQVPLRPPQRRWISNVSGDWIQSNEATSPAYWARQLRQPVRFADGAGTLLKTGPAIWLEVGPGRTASGLLKHHDQWTEEHRAITSLPGASMDLNLLPAAAEMWVAGSEIDWAKFYAEEKRQRIPLPTYPFGGDIHWVDATSPRFASTKSKESTDWFHLPSWQRCAAPNPAAEVHEGSWAIIGGDIAWRTPLIDRLKAAGAVIIGDTRAPGDARWIIDLRGTQSLQNETDGFNQLQDLARTLAGRESVPDSRLIVVTRGLTALAAEQAVDPFVSLLLGPARVLPREAPHCDARVVDISSPELETIQIDQLIAEARTADASAVALWRNNRRWSEKISAISRPHSVDNPSTVPTLITGGLGGLGGELARNLATQSGAHLVLMSRRQPSEETEAQLTALRELGAKVDHHVGDVCDHGNLQELRDQLSARQVTIKRVIHAAGVPASGALLRTTTTDSRTVLNPKVRGTILLWQVFGETLTEGFILMSSLSGRLGEFGQSDYAAANAFMDAFANAHHTPAKAVISLAWDAWDEVGMAARTGNDPILKMWHESRRSNLISPLEGVAAFHSALNANEPHILIATHPLEGRQVMPPESMPDLPGINLLPKSERPDLATRWAAAVSEQELKITATWEELLGISGIGIDDSFFDLGGHSLLATQVIARMRAADGVAPNLAEFFEHPTVRELAGRADRGSEDQSQTVALLEPSNRPDGRAPLSYAQQSLWLLDRMEGFSPHYNEFGAQRLTGSLDSDRLLLGLRHVMDRHEALRTSFVEFEDEPVQQIHALDELILDHQRLDWENQEETSVETQLANLAAELVDQPFDLTRAPLLRSRLVRLNDREHVLFIVVHHIVFDGWSSRNFFAEMLAAYAQEPLPPLGLQYADYAKWQRNILVGDHQSHLQKFWRDQFSPLPDPLDFPADQSRPSQQTFDGKRHPFQLDAELTSALRDYGKTTGASLYMILLAAYAAVLGRHATQDEVTVGSPVAGREHEDLEPLIGYFVNLLPMRIDLSNNPTFADLVDRVRGIVLAAYAHQALPFEKIVEAIAPPRDPSRHALFQSVLTFQNITAKPPAPIGIEIDSWEPDFGPARTDLDLYLWEEEKQISGYFLHHRELCSPTTIRRFSQRLTIFLTNALRTPHKPMASIKLDASFTLPGLGSSRSVAPES